MSKNIRERMLGAIADVSAHYQERDEIARTLMVAMVSETNALLLGLPGTAKSAVIRSLTAHVVGGRYAEKLMTPFTTLDELAGIPRISAMRDKDEFIRNHVGTPCDAHIYFCDEVYRGSSVALNAQLAMINEHTFNGLPIPLRTCIGATNMLPNDEGLDALDDRFLLRMVVESIKVPANFTAMLLAAANKKSYVANPENTFTLEEWKQATAETKQVSFSKEVAEEMLRLRTACQVASIYVSDRRWNLLVGILQASTWLDGSHSVEKDHLEILRHGLWRKIEDKDRVATMIDILDAGEVKTISDLADVFLRKCGAWERMTPHDKVESASKLAQARETTYRTIGAKLDNASTRAKLKARAKLSEIDAAYLPVLKELYRQMDLPEPKNVPQVKNCGTVIDSFFTQI